MEILLYKKGHTSLEIVQYGWALPFFRLKVPNISFCYGNPLRCVAEALKVLEIHEKDGSKEEFRQEVIRLKKELTLLLEPSSHLDK